MSSGSKTFVGTKSSLTVNQVLSRVGQTCTHIVYKNGLSSTVTRYRYGRNTQIFSVSCLMFVSQTAYLTSRNLKWSE